MKFRGVNITYTLQTPNVSCYPIAVVQYHEDKYGSLYVNNSALLQRLECKEIQYPVLAKENLSGREAQTHLSIVLDGTGKLILDLELSDSMERIHKLNYAKCLGFLAITICSHEHEAWAVSCNPFRTPSPKQQWGLYQNYMSQDLGKWGDF